MRSEFSSLTQRASSMLGSDVSSHLTILRPRDHPPSDLLSTFQSFQFPAEESWLQRSKMIFRILSFCLGPGNIWRFPEQSFISGQAAYIYCYLIYSALICVPLLVFELSLSQYFIKGFAKIFTLCPIMEGITLSMALYCVMANMVYASICVYSIIYFFSAVQDVSPHSVCTKSDEQYGCSRNATDLSHTPEHFYFFHYAERAMDMNGYQYNWRNAFVLALIWLIICAIIVFGILKYQWITLILSVFIIITLVLVAITCSAYLDGVGAGLFQMFYAELRDVARLRAWISSCEQAVVSLGIGAGPLTTIWSASRVKRWNYVDCIIVNIAIFVCSLLAGIIYYAAAGVVATKQNRTVDSLIDDDNDLNTFVLVTRMLNSFNGGLTNFTLIIYYLMLFSSSLYCLLEYTQIILLYISSYISAKKNTRTRIILGVCGVLYLVTTNVAVSRAGYPVLRSLNKNFIPTALFIILSFELMSVMFVYGLHNFCDDIDFLLEFAPSMYYQIAWIVLPGLFGTFAIISLYLKFRDISDVYDLFVLCLTILLTLVPIFAFAIYELFIGITQKNFKSILNPRLNVDWDTNSYATEINLPPISENPSIRSSAKHHRSY